MAKPLLISKDILLELKQDIYEKYLKESVGNKAGWSLSNQIHKLTVNMVKRCSESSKLVESKLDSSRESLDKSDILKELENLVLTGGETAKLKSADLLSKLQNFYNKEKDSSLVFEIVKYGLICMSCEYEFSKK